MQIDERIARELRKKIDIEMDKKEIEIVQHWRQEIEVIYKKKYENIGSLQVDLKALLDKMNNRIAILGRMIKQAT